MPQTSVVFYQEDDGSVPVTTERIKKTSSPRKNDEKIPKPPILGTFPE